MLRPHSHDAAGKVEAASDGFAAVGILPETLAALVADVAGASERIVKRLVPGGANSYPAGLARLTDARHLLVVIDEDQLGDEAAGDEPGERRGAAELACMQGGLDHPRHILGVA